MKNKYTTRRSILAGGLILAATPLIGSKNTQAAETDTEKTENKKPEADTIKTRKASCRCGKLSVTYEGPDPERITLCHCEGCQSRTGTAWSIQGRFPRTKLKMEGKSTEFEVPSEPGKLTCDCGGATYHFCPVCGTTVYWDIADAPDFVGVAIGTISDPNFSPPKLSGFESAGYPWSMNAADLPIKRLKLAE